MGALLVAFFVYGPKAIGSGVDVTFAVLLVLGLAFAWITGRRRLATHRFEGRDHSPHAPATEVASARVASES
jgi:hypothetical protein